MPLLSPSCKDSFPHHINLAPPQLGSIDESSIDKLSSVCEFAKLIRSKSGSGGWGGAGMGSMLPELCCVTVCADHLILFVLKPQAV